MQVDRPVPSTSGRGDTMPKRTYGVPPPLSSHMSGPGGAMGHLGGTFAGLATPRRPIKARAGARHMAPMRGSMTPPPAGGQ